MYKSILRPILFSFDPEKIHHFSFASVRLAHKLGLGKAIASQYRIPRGLEVEKMGLRFSNPVGLAAGFDKDGKLFSELASFGFGFVELGTVTPRPQAGNPKKRLFRLPKDQALINRMGFNNAGVDALVNRLKNTPKPPGLILGGNIGKNKDTPNERATEDYIHCFEKLFDYVDYFVVNVSSPNTPNLRELQDKAPLTDLLHQLQSRNSAKSKSKPILLKIAPDLNEAQLLDIVDIVRNTGIAGLVATNTTIDRSGLQTPASEVESIGAGGLSGKPVREKSTQVLRFLAERLKGEYTLIAVGGVYTAQDAREKLEAGADLVQVYTGFIYEGPAMVRRICRGLLTN